MFVLLLHSQAFFLFLGGIVLILHYLLMSANISDDFCAASLPPCRKHGGVWSESCWVLEDCVTCLLRLLSVLLCGLGADSVIWLTNFWLFHCYLSKLCHKVRSNPEKSLSKLSVSPQRLHSVHATQSQDTLSTSFSDWKSFIVTEALTSHNPAVNWPAAIMTKQRSAAKRITAQTRAGMTSGRHHLRIQHSAARIH